MKHYTKRAALAVLMSAAMLTASICPAGSMSLLSPENSMVAYAADYDWSGYLKKSADWFGSGEATSLCDTIIKYQLADGGWRKAMDDTSQTGSWAKSTTDNEATTSQIRILARTYKATNNSKYYDACMRGIDLLLNGQYDNGGWPQVFNDAGTYHAHITFNDGAMVRVLEIMLEMEKKSGDFTFIDNNRSAKAATAIDKAIDCILDMQIEQNGVKTAWCQQHDEFTLAPAPARAYELPSISASESVGIVNFLKKVAGNDNRIIKSINAAVTWMTNSAIYGIEVQKTSDDRIVVPVEGAGPIWARFYDLKTNKPMFVDRDGSIHSQMSELSQERRAGYAWYGTWGKSVIAAGLLPEVSAEVDINGTIIQQIHVTDGENGSDWKIAQNLAVGSNVFGDRDFTYTSVPDALLGAEYVQTACDSKNVTGSLGTLTAGESMILYVAYDTRLGSAPAWLSGWENTGMTFSTSNDVTMAVCAKSVAAGEQITLGDNTTGTGVIGYTMFAQSKPIVYDGTLIQSLNMIDRANGANWGITQNLAVGTKIFGDRDFTFTAVPDALLGAEYIQTACDSKKVTGNLANAVAGDDIVLYVGVDSRIAAPAWLTGWEKTDMTMVTSNDVTFVVYAKQFAAGEEITLGANDGGSNCINYVAAATLVPVETTTTTTTITTTTTTSTMPTLTKLRGDVNCDSFVKVNDVILLNRMLAEDTAAVISEQGMINAECDDVQGITGGDAIAILKMLANLV